MGNSQITVEIWGVCEFRHALKRTPSALPISSGQRVCNIDSKSSHSSADGRMLDKDGSDLSGALFCRFLDCD